MVSLPPDINAATSANAMPHIRSSVHSSDIQKRKGGFVSTGRPTSETAVPTTVSQVTYSRRTSQAKTTVKAGFEKYRAV